MPGPIPVLCIGAALWDVIAQSGRHLGEGCDVPGRIIRRHGGVALNVAQALAVEGAKPVLLTAVGRDPDGDRLVAELIASGVGCAYVTRTAEQTGRYLAIETDRGERFGAVADCTGLERAGKAILVPLADGKLTRPDTLWRSQVVVDSNLMPEVIAAILELPALAEAPLAFVAASPDKAQRLELTVGDARVTLYMNRREAEALCGRPLHSSHEAALVLAEHGVARAVITDGPEPVTLIEAGRTLSVAPTAVAPRTVTGAGDAFLAAHLIAEARGLGPEAALRAAIAASARHIAAPTIEAP